ncbi:primase-helicase zinc-binding domain-containing protein [Kluyvera sichuanensis]|uniref:primase-helicase zinc-binding domain-containing protein n=1 Tax=Kluyvera sichuanensis TaxID=2725494 RepID=UPI002FD497F1
MANFFTELNNYIKQNPIDYMDDFGIEILENQSQPCPICGGEDRFNWRSTGEHANTGHCRNGDGHDGRNELQPLYIITKKTGLLLKDIGARIGFNKSDKWCNPNHIYMRSTPKKSMKF